MEFLSKDAFKAGMLKLEHSFNTDIKAETLRVYWDYLSPRFNDAGFNQVVEKIILKERFFPAISVFVGYKGVSLAQRAH